MAITTNSSMRANVERHLKTAPTAADDHEPLLGTREETAPRHGSEWRTRYQPPQHRDGVPPMGRISDISKTGSVGDML